MARVLFQGAMLHLIAPFTTLIIQSKMSEAEVNKEELKQDDTLDRRTLFVRAVPEDATSEELSEYFSQFVPVKHAVIVTDESKKSRGFGFVSFTMDEDTLTALVEAKKQKFKGRFLRVDIAKRRDRKNKDKKEEEAREERAPREPVEKRKARIIIRNLPWSCKTPDKLRNIFQRYGAVHDAYIPTKKGGLMKGFAFVTMKKNSAAERAVKECVGLKIDGREVAVDLAVEKSKWEKIQEEAQTEFKSTGRERPSKQSEDDEEMEDAEEEEKEDGEDESDDEDESEENEEFDELNELKSDDEEAEEEDKREKKNTQEAFSVFVRNIPYDADRESLTEHFSQFGPVKYALPVIDKATGLARGSAFVAFKTHEAYKECLDNAPPVSNTSMLISDDVSPAYVYQGRILSVASTVDRDSASRLAERNSDLRKEVLGISKGDRDRRNLFLLNEGRITEHSKLALFISKTDMELREKSYKLRVQQLNKNATLHLSLTRLAIRNLPRAMTSKSLKALGRKAVVQFATEVKEGARQPLSKEEVNRSIKFKHEDDKSGANDEKTQKEKEKLEKEKLEKEKKKNKKMGVVKQAKVVMELKGSGDIGRSRGYGFVEFRDHKAALMGLRWLNAHEVTAEEITEGMTEEEIKRTSIDSTNRRKLIAEFAIENAQVVKRRKEKEFLARNNKRKRSEVDDDEEESEQPGRKDKKRKGPSRKGNMNKGAKTDKKKDEKKAESNSGVSDSVKGIIARKRRDRKGKK